MRKRRIMRALLASLAVAFVIGCAVVGYFVAEPPLLPVVQIAAARFALHGAHLAPRLAPEALAKADTLSMTMELLYAQERSKLVRFRRSASLEKAAADLEFQAVTTRTAAEDSLARGLAAAQSRTEELIARVEAVSAQAERMKGERKLQRTYHRALVALENAQVLREHSQLALLPVALDSAEVAVQRAEKSLGRSLERLHDPQLRVAWQRLVDQTIAETKGGGTAVLVEKLRRRCIVVQNRRVVARYQADFGRNGLAIKVYSGDGATPEGRYRVTEKNGGSRYYKALLIDYPNSSDLARYRQEKKSGRVPGRRGPGSLIEIHGNGGRNTDWTEGCIALRNSDMDELYRRVSVGTPITIVGAARLPGD
jgi:L,D-peptidoglycan transpeptidase YkuD (ErfK/YbiS/YcfS/YnhG family)